MTWQEFESLTAHVAAVFADEQTNVLTDVQEPSNISGTRQIDVVVEREISGFGPMRLAIEARDRKDKCDVQMIDAFVGKLLELPGINKGVMVNRAGYTRGAVEKSKAHGIGLYVLDETEAIVETALTVPVVVTEHRIIESAYEFKTTATYLKEQLVGKPIRLEQTGYTDMLLKRLAENPPKNGGTHKITIPNTKNVLVADIELPPADIEFVVRTNFYYGEMGDLPLTHALRDVVADTSKVVLDSDKMIAALDYRKWQEYQSRDSLPLHNQLIGVVVSNYPDKGTLSVSLA